MYKIQDMSSCVDEPMIQQFVFVVGEVPTGGVMFLQIVIFSPQIFLIRSWQQSE